MSGCRSSPWQFRRFVQASEPMKNLILQLSMGYIVNYLAVIVFHKHPVVKNRSLFSNNQILLSQARGSRFSFYPAFCLNKSLQWISWSTTLSNFFTQILLPVYCPVLFLGGFDSMQFWYTKNVYFSFSSKKLNFCFILIHNLTISNNFTWQI